MHPIEIFLELFKQALALVDNEYYGRHWWNDSMLNYYSQYFYQHPEQREVLKDYLDGYSERVFCYELYHQTRKLMESYELVHPNTFDNVKFQAELEKQLIGEIVENYFNVQALDKEFIPDFLLHTPLTFEHQYLIIEVKSNPNISFSGIIPDLKKIQQFITRYHYERGLFLTINTNPNRIKKMLLEEENKKWIAENISTPEIISILCKKKNDVPLFECTLDNLPE